MASQSATAASELPGWLAAASGGRRQPVRLAPRQMPGRGGGWGVVAEEPIQRGAPLVSVPLDAMLTVDSARSSARLGAPVVAGLSDWQALSLNLLSEATAADDSAWSPYLRMLPDQREHPLMWPSEWRGALLAGSPMLSRLEGRLRMVEEDTEAMLSAGGASIVKGAKLAGLSTSWAAATLLSRAFYLEIGGAEEEAPDADEEEDLMDESWAAGDGGGFLGEDDAGLAGGHPSQLALVPWADLLNHSSAAGEQSVLVFDKEAGCAQLRAHRDYQPGEEVFDSYGPRLSPTELLLDYGFVDPSNANHQTQLAWHDLAESRGAMNAALLRSAEAIFGGLRVVLSHADGVDSTSLACLRAASVSGAQLRKFGVSPGQVDDPGAAMAAMAHLSSPLSAAHEGAMLEEALRKLRALETGYGALPSAEDLGGWMGAERAGWLLEQVDLARQSECAALAGTRAQLERARERLAAGCLLEELYESP